MIGERLCSGISSVGGVGWEVFEATELPFSVEVRIGFAGPERYIAGTIGVAGVSTGADVTMLGRLVFDWERKDCVYIVDDGPSCSVRCWDARSPDELTDWA